MKKINNKLRSIYLVLLSALFFLASCNKDLEQPAAIPIPVYPTGLGIAAKIAANPNDSLFSRLIVRSGQAATLNDLTKTFTIFAVDNAGMKVFVNAASGGAVPLNAPDATFSAFIANSLPVASAAGIVMYNTIGQKFPFGNIPTTFPNYPLTSQIILDANQPFVRMNIFPVRGTAVSYVNNIPVTAIDTLAANGIIHHTFTIVAPPTRVLKDTINRTANLSIFSAAVIRGDSGQVGLNRLDSLLNYGVTNMTVLVPSDTAFKTLINGLSGGLVPLGAPNATFIGFLNNPAFVTAATVRGILAYHFFATNPTGSYAPNIRVFSVNFPTAPTFIKTLVNGSVAVHPGILSQPFFTGPVADSVRFTGLGTFPPGGAAYSGAPATSRRTNGTLDRHAVNGVFHVIDRVLLPQ
ncbi:hypothetical protein [Ferruginibacter sp.]